MWRENPYKATEGYPPKGMLLLLKSLSRALPGFDSNSGQDTTEQKFEAAWTNFSKQYI